MKRFALLPFVCLVFFSCMTTSPEGPQDEYRGEPVQPGKSYLIAVSPFSNLTGDAGRDYVGFQISEYVSSSLAGFPGIKVVERQQLGKILDEQKLQLSGLTEEGSAVEVGALLNAQQMVVGSFTKGESGYTVTGRLVDVASGDVLSSATRDIPASGRMQSSLRGFLISLLSGVPEYRLTIPALAAIETVTASDEATQADYAKALNALFRKNDAEAAEYLKAVLSESDLSYSVFTGAKTAYFEMASRMAGESFYAKMLEKQIARNESLVRQAEPLNLYRATVKLLYERTQAALSPDSFVLSVAEKERVDIGSVSAMVTLPKGIALNMNEETAAGIRKIFSEQSIAELGNKGLLFKKAPPSGELLSALALSGLFSFNLKAEMGYSVEFTDAKGGVIYRLDSEPLAVFVMDDTKVSFGDSSVRGFKETFPVDGFRLRNDGTVEIQAREVKKLSGIRVVLNEGSFRKTGSFFMDSDALWKSLILHAYRKQYTRIAAEDDPCPSIKDVVLSDALFLTDDEELGPVPVLSSDGTYADWAELTGVVYYGDSASATIDGQWTLGKLSGKSDTQTGAFSPSSVLYFEMPEQLAEENDSRLKALASGERLKFTALTNGGAKEASAALSSGRGWDFRIKAVSKDTESAYRNAYASYYADGKIYTSGGACLDAETGRVLWYTDIREKGRSYDDDFSVAMASGRFFITGSGTVCLDAQNGGILWKSEFEGTYIAADAARVVLSGGRTSVCLDAERGTELWSSNSEGGIPYLKGDSVLLVSGDDAVLLDGKTGKMTDFARNIYAVDKSADRICHIADTSAGFAGGKVLWRSWDVVTDTSVWERTASSYANSSLEGFTDSRLYFSEQGLYGGLSLEAVDAATGKTLWAQKLKPASKYDSRYSSISHIINGKIYFEDGYIHSERDGRLLSHPRDPASYRELTSQEKLTQDLKEEEGGNLDTVLRGAFPFRGFKAGNKGIHNPVNGYSFIRFLKEYEAPVITEDGFFITHEYGRIRVLDLSLIFDRE